jgi:hypothetical protein
MEMIQAGELRLPETQRGYVWQGTRLRNLLDSTRQSDCPLEVFDEPSFGHHVDENCGTLHRAADWSAVAWTEMKLSVVASRSSASAQGDSARRGSPLTINRCAGRHS